ncbi:MAG TPA: hypothetical protein VGM57_18625 [Pseudolabrys sp.]
MSKPVFLTLGLLCSSTSLQAQSAAPMEKPQPKTGTLVPVRPDNFIRAETNHHFGLGINQARGGLLPSVCTARTKRFSTKFRGCPTSKMYRSDEGCVRFLRNASDEQPFDQTCDRSAILREARNLYL